MPEKIFVVGIDGVGALGKSALAALDASSEILASPSLLGLAGQHPEFKPYAGKCVNISNVSEIIERVRKTASTITVLASGDPLFFGIGIKLIEALGPVEIIPTLSSVQLAAARLRIPWHDAFLVSLHGTATRDWKLEDLRMLLRVHGKLFILTGGENTPAAISRSLPPECTVHVLERLGYPDESITTGTAEDIALREFRSPNLMVVLSKATGGPVFGLSEGEFRHQRGLITKDEVRAVAIHKLMLPRRGVLWDIGSGSGSVAIEARRICPALDVYAIEKDPARAADIRHNSRILDAGAINVVEGSAPDALAALPSPERVFIGGSGGRLSEIIGHAAGRMAAGGVVVVSAITLENIDEAISSLKAHGFGVDIVAVSVSRSEPVDGKTYMKALNTVTLIRGRA